MNNEEKVIDQDNIEHDDEKYNTGYYANRPKIGRSGPSKLRQQFSRGMTYFLVVAASILFYFALLRLASLSDSIFEVFRVLKPVVYGAIIAYLLNPIVKRVDYYLVPVLKKKFKKESKAESVSRTVGIFVSLIFMVVLITALCNMLIPELYTSIRNLVFTLPGQLNDLVDRINEIVVEESTTNQIITTAVREGTEMFQTWLRTDLLSQANELMSNLTVGVINVLSEVFNVLIGVIISIYILFSKEMFSRQSKKCIYAVLPPRYANLILHITTKSNEIFGGFVIGKIIDSAIIGVLCFVILSVVNMPYALLVSVIIGVTNVIPFFGPYIGAIPSTILIMLSDPIKGLWFILIILLIQQFDGNILGPKILGNSTGLSAFWVIVSILLGGGLFGFVGMLMGVPTFAVIYYIVEMIINNHLERKNLPAESSYYDTMSYVSNSGKYVHSEEEQESNEAKGE